MNKANKRKAWFRGLLGIMKIFIKKPRYVYLGEEIKDKGIILSNHVGTTVPLTLEMYGPKNIRFWGAYQMNAGVVSVYKYLSFVFYHQKKHWNLFLARLFCIVAAPVTYIFYRGLRLISTYPDHRLKTTLSQSYEAIKNDQNIVIFPEDSTEGYLDELKGFHPGFILLGKMCLKSGIDLPIYVAYYKKKEKIHVIDKPILFSEVLKLADTKEEIANLLCQRCNELGKLEIND